MQQNNKISYAQLMMEAQLKTDRQEVGETLSELMKRFEEIIEDTVNKEAARGIKGKYYIHIWMRKEPFAVNSLRIFTQSRRTRPSPYQGHDHYLWSIEDNSKVTFEWCIPRKEIIGYILANPTQFDPAYVSMLRKFTTDKLEKMSDYLVNKKDVAWHQQSKKTTGKSISPIRI